MSAAERASEASSAEQANEPAGESERVSGQASGPVLTSRFSAVLNHCAIRYALKHFEIERIKFMDMDFFVINSGASE